MLASQPADSQPRAARTTHPNVSGTWPFLTSRDTFRADAPLDLRRLNERVAGESGFVHMDPDGESFVLGNGSPIRFWGVSLNANNDKVLAESAHRARFLAKRGVNMVRYGVRPLFRSQERPDHRSRPRESIDKIWKVVTALKREGIYTTLLPYWSASVKNVASRWGLGDWPSKESPFGLLFFNPKLQMGYKSWLKALMATANPYTGIPLAKDPAVAIIQLQNEDSLLFYTAQLIKGQQAELLGRQFGDWLKTKYGTLDDAFRAWGNDTIREDKPDQGIVGLLLVWEWTQTRQGGRKRRLDDQLQFYAETMYRFNKEIERYLHEDLGCKQLVNAGNWKSVDATKVDDAERWSYTANERAGRQPLLFARFISVPIVAGESTPATPLRTSRLCSVPGNCRPT